jgi:hypothetical protein
VSLPDANSPEYRELVQRWRAGQQRPAPDGGPLLVSRPLLHRERTTKRETDRPRDRRPEAFGLTALSELLAEPDELVDWAAHDLLLAGGTSALGAKPKVGKTTVSRNAVVAVATGTDFLGRTTHRGPVVYLALEEKRSRVREHFRRLLAALPEPGAELAPVWVHTGMAPRDALDALGEVVEAHGAVLAVCDPILKLIRVRDANDYAEVSDAFEPWTALA